MVEHKKLIVGLTENIVGVSKKGMTAASILVFSVLMLTGYGLSQASGTGDVVLDSNGIQLNTGTLDVNGNDIEDSGTTIWDQSNGYVPSGVLDAAGLSWNDLGISQSDVSSSDVGLGNVQNKAQVDEDGDTMSGDLTVSTQIFASKLESDSNSLTLQSQQSSDNDDFLELKDTEFIFNTYGSSAYGFIDDSLSSGDLTVASAGDVRFDAGDDTDEDCRIENTGDIECQGSKNWVHDLGNGSEAVYTSQESPEVRAVYEGRAEVDGVTNVSLPSHFSRTLSDSRPSLRSTATVQGRLAYAAVIEKTSDYLVLDSSEPATVNFRVTGIRSGYEDKKVVRTK